MLVVIEVRCRNRNIDIAIRGRTTSARIAIVNESRYHRQNLMALELSIIEFGGGRLTDTCPGW